MGCIQCKEDVKIHAKKLCKKCYNKYRYHNLIKHICEVCNKEKKLFNHNGIKLCFVCYKKFFRKKEECYICKKNKIIGKRIDGKPLCEVCARYNRKKQICSICNKEKIIESKLNGKLICRNCYKQPERKCNQCNKIKKIKLKKTNICNYCYIKNKKDADINFKIKILIRNSLRGALHRFANGKTKPTNKYGINVEAIAKHLGPFPNDGNKYHIDHIFPLAAFDFNNPIHIIAAFAPENHRWLLAQENCKKGDKYDKEEFNQYLCKFEKTNY